MDHHPATANNPGGSVHERVVMANVNCPHCGKSVEITRTDTITHEIRTWCQNQVERGNYPTRKEAMEALAHLNGSTVSTQYQKWLAGSPEEVKVKVTLTRLGLDPNKVPA